MARSEFPQVLQNRVWHTTSEERFRSIERCGWIVSEPNIPESERWKTSRGPNTYPYVRSIGGISLFEFSSFDPVPYAEAYPTSMWRTFVPYCPKWESSIWLEIDIQSLGESYIAATDLLARWNAGKAYRHTIMPRIEAASLAPIPVTAIRCILKSSKAHPELVEFTSNQEAPPNKALEADT